jgi:hypothetical protein
VRPAGEPRSRWPWPILPTSTSSTSTCRASTGSQQPHGWPTPGCGGRSSSSPASTTRRSSSARSQAALAPIWPSRSTPASWTRRCVWPPRGHAELQALEDDADQARQELEERKIIERAKGLLMSALRLSEAEAFRRLQLTARERNLRLVDVARRIVEQEPLLTPQPSHSRRSPWFH